MIQTEQSLIDSKKTNVLAEKIIVTSSNENKIIFFNFLPNIMSMF